MSHNPGNQESTCAVDSPSIWRNADGCEHANRSDLISRDQHSVVTFRWRSCPVDNRDVREGEWHRAWTLGYCASAKGHNGNKTERHDRKRHFRRSMLTTFLATVDGLT